MVVALRKESVDRNPYIPLAKVRHCESLSARRAWIEIVHRGPYHFYLGVALRKESVDRNPQPHIFLCNLLVSLSARRAWIEIQGWRDHHARPIVALRKESVDRNPYIPLAKVRHCEGRSPQGERG